MSAADKAPKGMFKHGAASEWTQERIARLSQQDIKQLRANAERLNEPDLVALCSEVLKAVRKQQRAK
jgi:hypothetical protein